MLVFIFDRAPETGVKNRPHAELFQRVSNGPPLISRIVRKKYLSARLLVNANFLLLLATARTPFLSLECVQFPYGKHWGRYECSCFHV